MIRLAVVGLFAAGVTLAVSACKQVQPVAERDAEKMFVGQCAKCHGPDGTGVPEQKAKLGVRNLTDLAWQRSVTDAQLRDSIRRGKKNMPAWGRALDDAQIEALVRKVRKLAGTAPAENSDAALPRDGGDAASD